MKLIKLQKYRTIYNGQLIIDNGLPFKKLQVNQKRANHF